VLRVLIIIPLGASGRRWGINLVGGGILLTESEMSASCCPISFLAIREACCSPSTLKTLISKVSATTASSAARNAAVVSVSQCAQCRRAISIST
jgi:hypothetical protein